MGGRGRKEDGEGRKKESFKSYGYPNCSEYDCAGRMTFASAGDAALSVTYDSRIAMYDMSCTPMDVSLLLRHQKRNHLLPIAAVDAEIAVN